MLQEVFYWLFNMSITATITGALILLIRLIKKIPRRLTVVLWAIPFLRMILPVGLNSQYSVMSVLSNFVTKTVVVYEAEDGMSFSMMNSVRVADTYFPITYEVNLLESIFSIASIIWLFVFLVIILMFSFTYFTTIYAIKDATHLRENVYLTDKVKTPAVYGIVKPKIVLPKSYNDKNVELILLHEKTHIRGFDNLWRVIAIVIVSVHWFNPFCWWFLKEFLSDLELSCDERVLIKLGGIKIKEYALALIESRRKTTMFTSSFGGAKIHKRIENILSFKKLTWLSLTAFIILSGVIFYTLLTNAD